MSLRQTEQLHNQASGIDTLDDSKILDILLSGQVSAVNAVRSAIPSIALAAEAMTTAITNGGSLVYAAAGSSGLMGLADGLELPGTFGINKHKVKVLMAGGQASLSDMAGDTEDDFKAAKQDAAEITQQDCVIAISASGNTPYPMTIIDIAQAKGACVVGISNTPETPVLNRADVAIYLPTPAEVIAGSTRLGAGSAQKVALNMMSTLMGIRLGHVYDGYMVNLYADNTKLIERSARIVAAITSCSTQEATACLGQAAGSVKLATLLALGTSDTSTAKKIMEDAGQNFRLAISRVKPA
ncbi:MAG: N-acetylmuramic acid 6-phosphate etherase [Gammaproteobacteria bacterium]|nr:N-acetylmuramic acid 6-phosphate etherase [Gammaproteobacteria bacterium]